MRMQLSMYVPAPESRELEAVRRLLDPVQSILIPAHVTLCRDDELARVDTDSLASRLADAQAGAVVLHFGRPEVFQGHGILLPCIAGEEGFHSLRELVLGSRAISRPAPHITLAHPRNPKAAGNCLANANRLPAIGAVTFTSVALIEQAGGKPWRVVRAHALREAGPGNTVQRSAPGADAER